MVRCDKNQWQSDLRENGNTDVESFISFLESFKKHLYSLRSGDKLVAVRMQTQDNRYDI